MTVPRAPSAPSEPSDPADPATPVEPSAAAGPEPDPPPVVTTPLAAATAYARRGWAVIPVPHRGKNPGFKGWEQARLAEPDLPAHFNGQPQNIGLLLGEPSGWVVDVDLDHARCVERADEFLPPTDAVFGRPAKPRSHRVYLVTGPAATRKFKSKSQGMLVELRSTGCQTVVPPSTHVSGEPIAWDDPAAEPAAIDPDELLAAVEALANAVKVELGEKAAPKPNKKPPKAVTTTAPDAIGGDDRTGPAGDPGQLSPRVARCVAAMLRMDMADHHDGSGRLFAACCRAVEHDLADADAVAAVRAYARDKPFPTDWSDAEVLARVRDAEHKVERGVIRRPPDPDGRPTILVDTDEHRVAAEAVAALAADPDVYARGGQLVRVLTAGGGADEPAVAPGRGAGTPPIEALPAADLRIRLAAAASFVEEKRTRGGGVIEVPAHPPKWLVEGVDARGAWPGVRPLTGVSDVPVLRADGTLCQAPGYDAASGVLYAPSAAFPPVHPDVSIDEAADAVDALRAVACDFRFEAPEHEAAWVASVLTPVARFAFAGPAPLFLNDANVRGAGKGLLANVTATIALGEDMPVRTYPRDPDEMGKQVTAIALAGKRVVCLDNIDGKFGDPALDAALTAVVWEGRILGQSKDTQRLPMLAVWYATGNNVAVAADTARRIVHVRIDVLDERPEARRDFRHPDLLAWVRRERPRLLAAALTVLAAYCRAGRPDQRLPPFGSFEGWSGLVRQAVVWAGLPDPCLTVARLAETADTTADALRQLVEAWRRHDVTGRGLLLGDLLADLYPAAGPAMPRRPEDQAVLDALRVAVENLTGTSGRRPATALQLGNRLKGFRRRVVGGRYLQMDPARTSKGFRWQVVNAVTGLPERYRGGEEEAV